MGKFKVYVSRNVGGVIAQSISKKWGIPLTANLGKYLGVLVFHGKLLRIHMGKWLLRLGKGYRMEAKSFIQSHPKPSCLYCYSHYSCL